MHGDIDRKSRNGDLVPAQEQIGLGPSVAAQHRRVAEIGLSRLDAPAGNVDRDHTLTPARTNSPWLRRGWWQPPAGPCRRRGSPAAIPAKTRQRRGGYLFWPPPAASRPTNIRGRGGRAPAGASISPAC